MKTQVAKQKTVTQVAQTHANISEQVRFLSERERRLVQFALEMGNLRCERVQVLASDCQQHGFTPTELLEVALMAVKEIDLPKALTWVNNGLEGK
jgi:alkylhydroperoxidase/carboxymuconolactone decarboxylase family protein YurZ